MTFGELKKLLKKNKCRIHHQGKKHEIWENTVTGEKFSVGRHDSKEIKTGTVNSILKDAGIK